MSKGHVVNEVPEFPLVVSDKVQELAKTKDAVKFLQGIKAWSDVEKVRRSRRFRAGIGKMRNRRRIHKLGPVVIYAKDSGLTQAFRNIPGIETINVEKLNLLRLAPGGHVGRFVIWTESAFRRLDDLYGTWKTQSTAKRGYNLPQPKMGNSDLSRILRSAEVQKVVRPRKTVVNRRLIRGNPLRKPDLLKKLNPHSAALKKYARIVNSKRRDARALLLRKRLGAQVSEADLKKAYATLGIKPVQAKAVRALMKKKSAATKATAEKIAAAAKKRAERAKANAENPRKSTKKTAAKK